MKTIYFNNYYKRFNILSFFLILISLFFLVFKGLNYGVDFKGGTLIELRVLNENIKINQLRNSFNKLNLEDVSIKNFGNKTDFIIKFKNNDLQNKNFISELKESLTNELSDKFTFRRVENVGPKVSVAWKTVKTLKSKIKLIIKAKLAIKPNILYL